MRLTQSLTFFLPPDENLNTWTLLSKTISSCELRKPRLAERTSGLPSEKRTEDSGR